MRGGSYDASGNQITAGTPQPYSPVTPASVDASQRGILNYARSLYGTAGVPTYLSGNQIKNDFATYFSNPANVGQTYDWPGGNGEKITLDANGVATLTSPTGAVIAQFNKDTPLQDLYKIPEIGRAWDKQFGGGTGVNTNPGGGVAPGGGTNTGATTGVNGFDIPTDIKPWSTTINQSYNGIGSEYSNALMSALMPNLIDQIKNRNQYIDQYTGEALGTYQQQLMNYLKQNIPAAISQLANRGIISSTEGNKILANVMSTAARDASTKGYETAMQAAMKKAETPFLLGNLAHLGQFTNSTGVSYQEDPTVMYRTIAELIKNMM